MATVDKEARLDRSREKLNITTIWLTGEDAPHKGDTVVLSQKTLKQAALDEDGAPRTGVVDGVLPDGMLAVKFDKNFAPGRKHAKLHPVEVEITKKVPRPAAEPPAPTAETTKDELEAIKEKMPPPDIDTAKKEVVPVPKPSAKKK